MIAKKHVTHYDFKALTFILDLFRLPIYKLRAHFQFNLPFTEGLFTKDFAQG